MMADRKPRDEPRERYVVVNTRELPDGVPVITIDPEQEGGKPRYYFAGDEYDGPTPESFHDEGILMTPRQAERLEAEEETEEAESQTEEEAPA
jgi:hypothetical protein